MLDFKRKQFRKQVKHKKREALGIEDKKKFPILTQKYKNKRLNDKIDLIQKKLQKQPSLKETRGVHEILDYFPRDVDIKENFFNQQSYQDVLSILKEDIGFKIKQNEIADLFKPKNDISKIKTLKFDFDIDKVNLLLYDLEYVNERINRHNALSKEIDSCIKIISSNILHTNARAVLEEVRALKAKLELNFQLEINYQKNLAEFKKVYAQRLETDFIACRPKEKVKILFDEFFDYLWEIRQKLIEKEIKMKQKLAELNIYKLYGKQLTNGYMLDNKFKYNKNYDKTVDMMNEGLADIKLGIELNKDTREVHALSKKLSDFDSFRAFNSDQAQKMTELYTANNNLHRKLLKDNAYSVLDNYKHNSLIIRLLDKYVDNEIIDENEKKIYQEYYERNRPDLLNKSRESELIKDIEQRLKKRVSMKIHKPDKKGFMNEISLKNLQRKPFKLNEDILTDRGQKEYSYNMFRNENLGAKLNFVNDYIKEKRKKLLDKKVSNIEREIEPAKGKMQRRAVVGNLSFKGNQFNYAI